MKIDGSDLQSKLTVYQNAQIQGKRMEAAGAAKHQTLSPPQQQDRVALSERGQLIADAQRAIASVPDIREPLVAKIQTELREGTYVIDNQKAAKGILTESMVNQAAMI